MVEQGIYFALGCIITALAALMFAPLFWRRALRLTRKRLQLQVPVSMQEILAERDQLRAEFAVERLRIEQSLEKVQSLRAADMADIGRRSIEVTTLNEQLSTARQIEREHLDRADVMTQEAAKAATELAALKAALETTSADVESWRGRAQASAAEEERLRNEIDGHRTTAAGLQTRVMGLEMRLTDAERANARLQGIEDGLRGRLEIAMGQATRHETSALSLRRECDDGKARIRALEDDLDATRDVGKSMQTQLSLHETEAQSLRRDCDHAKTRIQTLEADRNIARERDTVMQTTLSGHETRALSLRRDHDEAKARIQSLEHDLTAARERETMMEAKAAEHETAPRALRRDHDEAEARIQALEKDLDTSRERDKAMQMQASLARRNGREKPEQPVDGSPEDLRASIHALGLSVAMMTRRTNGQSDSRPARVDLPSPVDAD